MHAVKFWILRGALALTLLVVLAIAGIAFLLGTGPGRDLSASLVTRIVNSENQQFELVGVQQIVGNKLRIDQLQLSDKEGVWAKIEDLDVGYDLGKIIFGDFSVQSANIGSIYFHRFPQGDTAVATSGGTPAIPTRFLPAPFKTIVVDGLNVEQITFNEAIFGAEKRVALAGGLTAQNTPLQSSGNLTITDLENNLEIAEANWAIDPENDNFAVDVKLAEAADGMVANLLDIPGRPSVRMDVQTSGPLSALDGELAVYLNEKQFVDGELVVSLGETRQTITAALSGEIAPLMPDMLVPLVAGRSDLNFVATRNSDGAYVFENAAYTSALTSLAVSGEYVPEGSQITAHFAAEFGQEDTEVEFRPTEDVLAKVGVIDLSGEIKGSLNDAALALKGSLKSLSTGEIGVDDAAFALNSQNLNFIDRNGQADVQLSARQVRTGQDNVDPLLSGQVQLASVVTLNGDEIEFDDTQIASDTLKVSTNGSYDLATRQATIAAEAVVQNSVQGLYQQLFASEQASIAAELSTEDGKIAIQKLQVVSANLNADLSGELMAADLQAAGQLSLKQLNQFHPKLAGSVSVAVSAQGPLTNPAAELDLTSAGVAVDGQAIESLQGKISGTLADGIDVGLTGNYRGEPLEVSSRYTFQENESHHIKDIRFRAPASQIEGEIIITRVGAVNGQLDIMSSDLSQIAPLLLQDNLAGSIEGRLVLAAADGRQDAELEASAPTLQFGDIVGQDIKVQLLARDIFAEFVADGTILAEKINVGGELVEVVKIDLSGNASRLPISASAKVDGEGANIEAVISSVDGRTNVDVTQFNANYKSIPVALQEPGNIALENGITEITLPALRVGGGQVSVNGGIDEKLNMTVNLSDLPLSLVDDFARTGQSLRGALSGTAQISGTVDDPVVSYSYRANSISVAASRESLLAALNASGSGKLANNQLTIDTNIDGGNISANANGAVNLAQQTLNVSINGKLPFEYLAQPLSRAGIRLSGAADVSARVSGSTSSPAFSGRVTTTGARILDVASKLAVTNIEGAFDLSNNAIQVANLTGQIGADGRVVITGQTSLAGGSNLNSDYDIKVDGATYDDGVISTKFDAALRLSGPLASGGAINGTATIDKASVSIPEQLPNAVSAVEVTHKSAPSDVRQQAAELQPKSSGGGSGAGLSLNIDVNAPRQIYVRGRGLDAELGGRLLIAGTTGQPRATGEINLLRGRMDLLTKRFDFDTGQLLFRGPLDPRLNFVASTRNSGYVYSIVVQGFASEPEFLFKSSPSLPQDEVIANLFFGRSLANLSALQIAQLANAVATLNGSNSGPGLLGRLRNLAGLDNIDIKTNEEGQATVGIGGYLNDRTYVNVEKGTSAKDDKVTIDLEITESLKARGQTSGDGNTEAGIFYEKDY